MNKVLLVCILVFFQSTRSQAQDNQGFIIRLHQRMYQNNKAYHFLYKKLWEVDTTKLDSSLYKKSEFFALPYITYSPETKFKFGLAGIYSYYTHKDSITRVSTQSLRISYSTTNQAKMEYSPDIWTKNNKIHLTGYIYGESFPFYFYGIGNNTQDSNKLLIQSKQFLVDVEAEKELIKRFRLGLTLRILGNNFNYNSNAAFFQKYPGLYAQKGGAVYFTGISLVYDTRDLINFTTKGTYLRLNPAISLQGISNLNTLTTVNFSGIQFIPITKKSTLGINLVANTIIGNQVPFFLLNQLGGSSIERGYYSGQYRDKSMLEGQVEFRYHFIPRLALVGFLSEGSTWGLQAFSFSEFKPSAGGGIHYVFSIPNQLTFRLDYGKGIQKSHGFYFELAEAF